MLEYRRSLLGNNVGACICLDLRRLSMRVHSRLIWLSLLVLGVGVGKVLKLPCQCTAWSATTICLCMGIATQ